MSNVIIIPLVILAAALYYSYFLFTRLNAQWTMPRLFRLSLVSIPVFLVIGVVLMAFWWPLAFDWAPNAKTPLFAYVIVWAGIIYASAGVLSAIVALISGIIMVFSRALKR